MSQENVDTLRCPNDTLMAVVCLANVVGQGRVLINDIEIKERHVDDAPSLPCDRSPRLPAPRLQERSKVLHVLLRHRPRSIPQAQESA